MGKEFSEQEIYGMWSFLVETFKFTEEQIAAIDHQIPMTQEMYEDILDRCEKIGSDADNLFYRMLMEYPDFMSVRADKILEEVKNIKITTLSEEEKEVQKQKLYARIHAEYGENVI